MRKRRVVGRIYRMIYSWKGHKDKNRHKNRIKRSGQAWLVYVKSINRNISTTWRWTRGDWWNKIVKIWNEFGPQSSLPSVGKRFTGNPLTCFQPVSENAVHKFVQNSAPKTCELDPVPTSLLMECLLPTLTQIVNDSLTCGIFPQIHKSAVVKPLLKKLTLWPQWSWKFSQCVKSFFSVQDHRKRIVLSQMSDHLSSTAYSIPSNLFMNQDRALKQPFWKLSTIS